MLQELFPQMAGMLAERSSLISDYNAKILMKEGEMSEDNIRRYAQYFGAANADTNVELKTAFRYYYGDVKTEEDITPEVEQVFKWIVHSWGGIRGFKIEPKSRIIDFLNGQIFKYTPISSLSKIAAFIRPDHFVYDSRVAISLNFLLLQLGGTEFFAMPMAAARNGKVIKMFKEKTAERGGTIMTLADSYSQYRDFVLGFSPQVFNKSNSGDYLEMLLFTMAKYGVEKDGYVYNEIKDLL